MKNKILIPVIAALAAAAAVGAAVTAIQADESEETIAEGTLAVKITTDAGEPTVIIKDFVTLQRDSVTVRKNGCEKITFTVGESMADADEVTLDIQVSDENAEYTMILSDKTAGIQEDAKTLRGSFVFTILNPGVGHEIEIELENGGPAFGAVIETSAVWKEQKE